MCLRHSWVLTRETASLAGRKECCLCKRCGKYRTSASGAHLYCWQPPWYWFLEPGAGDGWRSGRGCQRLRHIKTRLREYDDDSTMMYARYTKQLGWAIAGTALMAGMLLLGEQTSGDAPVLSLSQAVQIALDNNRPVNIAKLDIAKSKWEVAQTKTKRFPAITTYLFASGDITSPTFNFPAGSFGQPIAQSFAAFQRNYRKCIGAGSTTALAALPDPSCRPRAAVVCRSCQRAIQGQAAVDWQPV